MSLRKIFFWTHLAAGVTAGTIILIMCVTGVLLTYEKQLDSWVDRSFRIADPPASGRLQPEALLASAESGVPGPLTSLTLRADPHAPAEIQVGQRLYYANPYTGAVTGQASTGIRTFFSQVKGWHRWLGAAQGPDRDFARNFTGAANLLFVGIILIGMYLWIPRRFAWPNFRAVMMFRGGLAGRARDFNWHNTIGIWCAIPLFVIALSGVVMSYPWANRLVYSLTGSPLPVQGRGGEGGGRGAAKQASDYTGLNKIVILAEHQIPDWTAVSLRVPNVRTAPVNVSLDRGNTPGHTSRLTFDRATGALTHKELPEEASAGARLRLLLRFGHTGEAGGMVGQTIAGIASLGGVVLVWTGLALSWRRLRAWQSRRARQEVQEAVAA